MIEQLGDSVPVFFDSIRNDHARADSPFQRLVFVLATSALRGLGSESGSRPPSGRPSAGRSRSPGTPRREERIRYFDVKHVKAELTLATKQKEVRGTVTHTLSPLHPYLTRVELDCGPELKVTKVTKRAKGEGPRRVLVRHGRRQAHRHPRQSPWPGRDPRPGDRVLGIAHEGAAIRPRRPGLSRKGRSRSGPRARPRIRTTGFPATTTPTSARPPR